VVLYAPPSNASAAGAAGGATLVLSPLSNPHGTIMGTPPGGGAGGAVGINSYATAARAGFSVTSIAVSYCCNGVSS